MVEYDYLSEGEPTLIDGRNRLAAMERVGIHLRLQVTPVRGSKAKRYALVSDNTDIYIGEAAERGSLLSSINSDPAEYIASANIHRRHLTQESKRALIAQLLKENPERSDRAHCLTHQ